ncbi:MAG TPA: VWA domain-containing protein, partial [Candidatus Akkermansia intestinavium]|nr:VWA domain-containing protein [Candidatus Akkermansia intestinavium]
MSFLYPYVLLALALPLLLAALVFVAHHRRNRDWRKLVSAEHEAELVRRRAPWRSLLPPMLGLLALAGCIIAAARPINGYSDSGMSVSGRNLLIALDLSRSMETRDVTPSRLEEARAAAYELIDALPNDKIGLILFAGQADLIVPLTYDHTALRDTLAQVNRDWAGYGGTNFGSVLKCAMSTFERNAPGSSNALVILSDGEDTVSNTEGLAEEARKQRMLVITVGIGTPQGDTIPDPSADDGLYTDAQGKHVISKLNAESLQRFAEATGGSFFLMNNGANLTDFARQAVAKIDTHEETTASGKTPRDLFAYVAAASLLLLIASIITGTDWRRARGMRSLSSFGAALLLLLGGAAGNADAAPDEGSVKAFRRGLELQSEKPEEARQAFSEALLDEDPAMQAAATYQLSQMDARGVLDHLRRLYGEQTDDQAEEGIAPADKPKPSQPTPEDLRGIIDDLRAPMDGYRQALKDDPELTEAGTNVAKLETLVRNLEAEIKRLEQQQQQQQQQQ